MECVGHEKKWGDAGEDDGEKMMTECAISSFEYTGDMKSGRHKRRIMGIPQSFRGVFFHIKNVSIFY